MDSPEPLTEEVIQKKFRAAVIAAGNNGLRMDSRDLALGQCAAIGITSSTAVDTLVNSAVTKLVASDRRIVQFYDGRDITIMGGKGTAYPAKEFTVYRYR